MKTTLAFLLLAAAALTAHAQAVPPARPAAVPAASGRCGVCHPAERVQFERSSHAPEGVRCVSCHGGDDRSLEAGHISVPEVVRIHLGAEVRSDLVGAAVDAVVLGRGGNLEILRVISLQSSDEADTHDG